MQGKIINQPKKELWWLVYIGIAWLVVETVRWQITKTDLVAPLNQPALPTEVIANPSDTHKPVYIRSGIIKDKGADYLILETEKLVGQGRELITILLTKDTKVIEIQIPSYMNDELREKLTNGGDVMNRLEVEPAKLYVGQAVEIVSSRDIYGFQDVEAARVEYKIVVNTEQL